MLANACVRKAESRTAPTVNFLRWERSQTRRALVRVGTFPEIDTSRTWRVRSCTAIRSNANRGMNDGRGGENDVSVTDRTCIACRGGSGGDADIYCGRTSCGNNRTGGGGIRMTCRSGGASIYVCLGRRSYSRTWVQDMARTSFESVASRW